MHWLYAAGICLIQPPSNYPKTVIEKVYQYNPEFVELYDQTYSNPANAAQWKQWLEYEHKARNF